jgi:hypothetical protein
MRRTMLQSERACIYLRELEKPNGRTTLARVLPPETVDRIAAVAPTMIATTGPLRRALRRASRVPSRLGQFLDIKGVPNRGP